jgi:hypothetical protein
MAGKASKALFAILVVASAQYLQPEEDQTQDSQSWLPQALGS